MMKAANASKACAVAGLLASAGLSQAAVSVVGSALADNTAAPGTTLTVSGFSMGAGNAVVVAISTEHENGTSDPSFAVTYGGIPLTNSISANQVGQGAAIFWALAPATTTGDVVVTLGSSATTVGSVSVLSLGGVASVGATQAQPSIDAADIVLNYNALAGDLVVASHVDNSFTTGGTTTITGGNVDTILQAIPNNQNGISAAMTQAYGEVDTDGAYSETFIESREGNSSRNAAALAVFSSVPEPSVALLGGLGLLGLARRRRG